MSSKTKLVVGVVVVVVIAGALWLVYGKKDASMVSGTEQTGAVANSAPTPALASNVAALDAQVQALSGSVAGLSGTSDPKAVAVVASSMLTVAASIDKLGSQFQALVSTAGNAKQNISALQAALKDMAAQNGNANSIAGSVSANASNTKKPMNAAGVAAAIAQLKTAAGYIAAAQSDIHVLSTGLAK